MNRFENLGKPLFFVFSILFVALRSLRFPNDWSEAHWLITYDMGLIKRALAGSILKPLFQLLDPSQVELFILAISFASVFTWVALLWKVYRTLPLEVGLMIVLSPMLVMMFHLNGYFDYQLVFLGVISLILLKRKHYLLTAMTLSIGILLHENCLFIAIPAVFYALYDRYGIHPRAVYPALKVFTIPALTFLAILIFTDRNSESEQIQKNIISGLSAYPFVATKIEYVAYSFTHSFVSYFKWRRSFLNPVFIPVFLNCLAMFFVLAQGKPKSARVILAMTLAFPLLLHLIAVDTGRIWIFPLLIGLQLLYFQKDHSLELSARLKLFCIVLIVVNSVYTLPLMDELTDRVPIFLRIGMAFVFLFPFLTRYKIFQTQNG